MLFYNEVVQACRQHMKKDPQPTLTDLTIKQQAFQIKPRKDSNEQNFGKKQDLLSLPQIPKAFHQRHSSYFPHTIFKL